MIPEPESKPGIIISVVQYILCRRSRVTQSFSGDFGSSGIDMRSWLLLPFEERKKTTSVRKSVHQLTEILVTICVLHSFSCQINFCRYAMMQTLVKIYQTINLYSNAISLQLSIQFAIYKPTIWRCQEPSLSIADHIRGPVGEKINEMSRDACCSFSHDKGANCSKLQQARFHFDSKVK